MKNNTLLLCLTLSLTLLQPTVSRANSLLETRSLDFGAFVIQGTPPLRVVMGPDSAESFPDGGIYKMKAGHYGTFQITHIGAGTQFYITIDPTVLTRTTGSPSFDIDTFTFDPANNVSTPITADSNGAATVNIGATLHVRTSTTYGPGAYRGTYTFMLNF